MAAHTLDRSARETACHAGPLTPDAEDTVTVIPPSSLHGLGRFRFLVHPTTADPTVPVWVSIGAAAEVGGANSTPVWPGTQTTLRAARDGNVVVHVLSEAAHSYSVEV